MHQALQGARDYLQAGGDSNAKLEIYTTTA
jgi:hypothetical protein